MYNVRAQIVHTYVRKHMRVRVCREMRVVYALTQQTNIERNPLALSKPSELMKTTFP